MAGEGPVVCSQPMPGPVVERVMVLPLLNRVSTDFRTARGATQSACIQARTTASVTIRMRTTAAHRTMQVVAKYDARSVGRGD